jgi:hypothetical protein
MDTASSGVRSDRHRPVQFGDFARAVEPVGEVSIQLVEEGAAAVQKQVAAAGTLGRMT